MTLAPIESVKIDYEKISLINEELKCIYRLITFSRDHVADDLLDRFLKSTHDLQELLSIKNAQMEAQDEQEANEYLACLKSALNFIISELKSNRSFSQITQLFHLLRIVSPEAHEKHPNKFRQSVVQIGRYTCPNSNQISGLVSSLFYQIEQIRNPIIKAIYFHHELIRIHPFVDGNGRVTRIAKNWLLMYHLYPPIFIRDSNEKVEYINTLEMSFEKLNSQPSKSNEYMELFFEQEIDRILRSIKILYQSITDVKPISQ